ncbi:MAG TPA: hypothetical protein VN637_14150 [Roseiarcus sp.]|jgi:hypothetical protein|nr:hypothetical protein [Roseiarcus sp.]
MSFLRWLAAVALIAAPGLVQAQEGSGCGGFKWSIEGDRAALVRADKPSLPNGGAVTYDVATTLELQPFASAGLPKAPERAPRSPSAFAGHFVLAAPAKPGVYRLTMSSGAWVDVLDGGAYLHPVAFSGARDCEGARRSVKFDLPARPLALQFSGVPGDRISVIVSPDR